MSLSRILACALILVVVCSVAAYAQDEAKPETPAGAAGNPNEATRIAPPGMTGAIKPVIAPWAQRGEPPPHFARNAAPENAAPAAPVEEKKPEHWTFFNLIPMEWTYSVALQVADLCGIPRGEVDKEMYDAHGLMHVTIMFFVLVLITIISIVVGGHYKKILAGGEMAPAPGVSVTNFMEMIVKTVIGFMEEVIGGHNPVQYLPLIGSLAIVILFNNLLGLIPGFFTATDNINTTAAMAVTVFVLFNYYGMRTHGVGKYLAHFMGPLEGKIKYIMAPLMVPIEMISTLVRPVSLSLRLMGNMIGDHKVFAVFMAMTPIPFLYPIPFLALGLLVAIVQTLVFCLLSMVYIGLATAEEH
jgi:F-type H+-transporting ATPase subunit a